MKTKENLNFNGFSGSGSYLYSYKGFDFSGISSLTKVGVDHRYPNEHTGYNNDLHGSGEAFVSSSYYGAQSGFIRSPSNETFSLKSGDFASATDKVQHVYFTAFDGNKEGAQIEVQLSCYKVTHIDFASYGKDFKNITGLSIYGNPNNMVGSKYGAFYAVVMDNLKVAWNGAVPDAQGMRHQPHVAHGVLGAMRSHAAALSSDGSHAVAPTGSHDGFHSVLTSPDRALGHHGGGLTAEFSLPASEHFGT